VRCHKLTFNIGEFLVAEQKGNPVNNKYVVLCNFAQNYSFVHQDKV
jgi:hypothetical protein